MGRARRPYLPGAIIHLTARTLRRERRFTPRIRSAALGALAEVLPRSGSRLLAVAMMSNHLHLVIQQGERPLSALMQPFLQRLARMVHRAHGIDGPVFWRHYASQPCHDPRHARNSIAYAHLNPVRAGICRDPRDYRWTSHAFYVGAPAIPPVLEALVPHIDPALALPLFATGPIRSLAELHEDYRAFMAWRLGVARDAEEHDPGALPPEPPPRPPPAWSNRAWSNRAWSNRAWADQAWSDQAWRGPGWGASLSPLFHPSARRGASGQSVAGYGGYGAGPRVHAPDLASIARSVLAAEAPGIPMSLIRGRGGGREKSRIRHAIMRRARAAGHKNVDIAGYLGVSESAVSAAVRGVYQTR